MAYSNGQTNRNAQMNNLQSILQKKYESLGRQYYKDYKERGSAKYKKRFEEIAQILEQIEALNQEPIMQQSLPNQCSVCGNPITEGMSFCEICGTKVNTTFYTPNNPINMQSISQQGINNLCPRCGAIVHTAFCTNCGMKL